MGSVTKRCEGYINKRYIYKKKGINIKEREKNWRGRDRRISGKLKSGTRY